jgi:hypothetical protein
MQVNDIPLISITEFIRQEQTVVAFEQVQKILLTAGDFL